MTMNEFHQVSPDFSMPLLIAYLTRPGMYVGQVQPSLFETWLVDKELNIMQKQPIMFSPALVKVCCIAKFYFAALLIVIYMVRDCISESLTLGYHFKVDRHQRSKSCNSLSPLDF